MIGVLNAYHWDNDPNSYQAAYKPMFLKFLNETFHGEDIRFYEIPKGELPNSPFECDIWFISGSAKSVYEKISWVQDLKEFVQQAHENNAKIVGFCFGHQLIAQALGGKVEKSSKGWGIGVREFNINKKLPLVTKMPFDKTSLLYSHQDQVVNLPPGAVVFGTSDFCPYEAFYLNKNILSFQGHPEFTKDYAKARYLSRVDQIGKDTVATALGSLDVTPLKANEVWALIKTFRAE